MGSQSTRRTIAMNMQELFDTVVAHLRQQNAQSLKHGACAYRGDDGKKCAAGCLIPDEEYNPTMEGWNVTINSSILNLLGDNGENMRLLLQLQHVHDMQDVEEWEACFQDIAFDLDLRLPPKA